MTYAIKFQDLTLGYDRNPAVHRLRGEIAEGSLTAIVGPNGAGKSTMLKGVVGTLRPLEGRIAFGGLTRSEIAYLPQQSDVDRSFPIAVADLVGMGLWREIGGFAGFRAGHRRRVAEAIAAVGLEGFERRPIGSLSGGQIQRALFARLLLQDARLVLLDEPFTAVDVSTMADLIGVVRRWHGEGRTVLAVLHDVDTVRAHFPRTLMLARELVAHGPTAKVLTAENQFRARQMCEACARPPAHLRAERGVMWEALVQPFADFGFMRRALMGCLAISVGATPVGVFLMLRRMSLTGDAMAHAILPGAAVGYLVAGLSLGAMTVGGLIAGMAVALLSGFVTRATALREDASLAAFYLISLAAGVLIVSTRGSNVDLMHVLFGTVLALDNAALILLGAHREPYAVHARAAVPAARARMRGPAVPAFGQRAQRHGAPDSSRPRRAQPRGRVPGARHADGGRHHDPPRRRGAVLDREHRRPDRGRDRHRDALERERSSSLLLLQPALRPGDHPCGRSRLRALAGPRAGQRSCPRAPYGAVSLLPSPQGVGHRGSEHSSPDREW